jgi:hypothetical protein
MKATDQFKEAIKTFLEGWAMEAEDNLNAYTSKDKKLDDCVTYILNQVKKSGVNGFADQEIFDMAIEYYTTKDINVGNAPKGQVVINRTVELTDAEKAEAKEKAMRELMNETKSKARKKPTPKTKAKNEPKTSVEKLAEKKPTPKAEPPAQPTLF